MQKLWLSIFWKVLSCGCFAGINVLVRYLSGGSPIAISQPLPIYSIMFFQNLIGTLLITAIIIPKVRAGACSLKTTRPWRHTLRVVSAALGIGLWYLSLKHIPVTQVVALSFVAPIITTLGAVIFLKENFNIQRKLAVYLSLIGGFFIARPDIALQQAESFNLYMLLPLVAAFVFSLDKVLTRQLLTFNESVKSLTWYLLVFTTPLSILPMFYYGWVTPDIQHVPWLIVLGVLGVAAHYAFNKAHALAELTLLLPFGAAKIILCAMISYVTFAEAPNTLDMWFGIIIITFSTAILSIPEYVFRRKVIHELS